MSARARTPSPHTATSNSFKTNTKPPPIPIPHLLLIDRSRLKPIPKPAPKPLPAQSFIPLRARLKSTSQKPPLSSTTPSPDTTTTLLDSKPKTISLDEGESHVQEPPVVQESSRQEEVQEAISKQEEPTVQEPSKQEPQQLEVQKPTEQEVRELQTSELPEPDVQESATEQETDQGLVLPPAEQQNLEVHKPAEPELEEPEPLEQELEEPEALEQELEQPEPLEQELEQPKPLEQELEVLRLTEPDFEEPESELEVLEPTEQERTVLEPMSNDQDQIQPWQHQLNQSQLDHSSLERANSAAARLDSLARLNGNLDKTPLDHHNDSLPPFLMAKHIEETKKKAGLISPPLPIPHYPLPLLPPSLGFGVGPNGRGVPRLSALQRKALEKLAIQQDSQDLSTATTSLTRSHTTTGTESRKLLINQIQSSSTDETDQRQQARSNLIRKLSSRGPNPRSNFPIRSPAATTQPTVTDDQQNVLHQNNHNNSTITIQDQLPPSFIEFTSSDQDQEIDPSDLLPLVPDLPLSFTPLHSLPDHLPHPETPLDEITFTTVMSPISTENAPLAALRYSLESLDSQTDPEHAIRSSSDHIESSISNPHTATTILSSSAGEPIASQSYPSSSSNQSHPVPETSSQEFSGDNSISKSAHDSPVESIAESFLHPTRFAATPDLGASTLSPRSSIVSRLKARASLSSRIDRSIATGHPSSPSQLQQSSIDQGSEGPIERRRSAINGSRRTSRPSISSTLLHRVRPAANETSEDRSRQSQSTLSRVGSPTPSYQTHNGERPLRPTRAPPITQAHSVVAGRAAIPNKRSIDLGPSQFPPTSHLVRTHMPVASAVDLARYNDHKLAPFPALLDSSPSGSPERARSPPRMTLKNSRSQGHGILSSASNFFRSPSRNRADNLPSTVRGHSTAVSSQAMGHPTWLNRSSEAEDDAVESSRWQSIGDAAGKMNLSTDVSRSSTMDSNSSSVLSMVSNQRREQILARLSPFLRPSHPTMSSQDHKLNDPPRKLLWHQPVLQVVNATSVKDRYLFLFNDLLVITKPIMEFEESKGERVPKLPITLKQSFLTKSVVEIKNLRCVCTNQTRMRSSSVQEKPQLQLADDEMVQPEQMFRQAFLQDPTKAIQNHFQNPNLERIESEIAKLLITTASLDKRQLGQYLTDPDRTRILNNYLDRFNLAYIRIEDSLRSVLLSVRLPADPLAIERFLTEFGVVWTSSNPKVGLSAALVTRWATGMIVLSEHLHDSLTDSMRYVAGFIGFPNEIKTEAAFVDMIVQAEKALVAKGKPGATLPQEKLEAMLKKSFQSIRRDRLIQARANADDADKIEFFVEEEGGSQSSKLPSHILYQTPSDSITVKLPQLDSHFGIKLFGSGLSFEPSFLSFSQSASASFRIVGKALGVRQISFIKVGRRAAAYEGLPLDANVSVERAFMKHTVQVGFLNHMMAKRKYLFSFLSGEAKADFLELVDEAQTAARYKQQAQQETPNGPQAVARAVALQVLIDTLIVNEDLVPINVNPHASTTVGLKMSSKSKFKKSAAGPAKKDEPKSGLSSGGKIRSNSLSETYIHTLGRAEIDLHQAIINRRNQAQEIHVQRRQHELLQEQLRSNLAGGKLALNPYSYSNKENPVGGADEKENEVVLARFMKSGTELVKHCEQNSFVPLVLSFLSMGIGRETPSSAPKALGGSPLLHHRLNTHNDSSYHYHHVQPHHQ
ncbi:hypothetical protein PCASD_25384 [Puccinia coronata f. sp. avenae]|uniref:SEC7 domain-containing protein n=2 Tax=Puccinia coronata f. sp. avenae TaxID=200324 RepID=A0A2N5S6W1_9BASI|nr:hypothetical protein PCASD_25384 [Puccinia coronata f. sp. avenae]